MFLLLECPPRAIVSLQRRLPLCRKLRLSRYNTSERRPVRRIKQEQSLSSLASNTASLVGRPRRVVRVGTRFLKVQSIGSCLRETRFWLIPADFDICCGDGWLVGVQLGSVLRARWYQRSAWPAASMYKPSSAKGTISRSSDANQHRDQLAPRILSSL